MECGDVFTALAASLGGAGATASPPFAWPQAATMQVAQPIAPAPQQQVMQVQVPQGVGPGQQIQISGPSGQPMLVTVPAGIGPGGVFLVGVEPQVAVATTAGPESALAKLGPVGSRYGFELRSAQVTSTTSTSIQGTMPVTSEGRNVATLTFESAQKGRHLRALLTLPSGEQLATFERGTPPATQAGALFSSIGQDFGSGPAPPVAIGLLGQPYGTFQGRGMTGPVAKGGLLDGTHFRYVNDRTLVASTEELEVSCVCPRRKMYKYTPAKRSAIGKKEAPLPVLFGTATANGGVIHLVLPPTRFFFTVHEVLCETSNALGGREKLDILVMGATMAAILATEKQAQAGGM